jgi:hypothetical protein
MEVAVGEGVAQPEVFQDRPRIAGTNGGDSG